MDNKSKHIQYEWIRNTEKQNVLNTVELIQQALIHHKTGRLKEAEQIYRQVLNLEPNNADAYCNLGAVLDDQERLDEAITCYKRVTSIKPNYTEACHNLSLLELLEHNFKSGCINHRYRYHNNFKDKNKYFPHFPKTTKPLYS